MNVPHNAWLKRSDANVELRGWLTTWKTPQQPVHVAGEIDAVRGWYTFQSKKFTVSEGQVTLTGQDFDPLLKLVAVHETGEYTVKINIGGKLTKPTIKLESEPTLDQADILSVLVFGKPAKELNKGQSRDLRDRALDVAGGYVASEFRQSVAEALGVDNLEVQPSAAGLGETSTTVGKYVSEDVFVSISHKFAQQSVEQLRVQYFVTPRWTIETSTDTKGDSGFDVFWKRRY
jgi:translocation and assembly module TamB